jgi:chromosome segregation ATPase
VHERDKLVNDIAAFEKIQIGLKNMEQAQSESAYRIKHLQTQYQEALDKLEDRNSLLIESQSQIKFMQQQLAPLQQELVKLREQNRHLEKENWSLQQNKSLLPA